MNTPEKSKSNADLVNVCEKTLGYIQRAMNVLTLSDEEKAQSHYEVQKTSSKETTEQGDHRQVVRQKEMIICKTLPEDDFVIAQNERKETNEYPLMGVRLVTKETTHYVQAPGVEIFIIKNETFTGAIDEVPTSLLNTTSIKINLLND